MKKQSFITGAFLLAAATALGKIFSAIFKIPLDRFFLGADGMAIFNASYNIYTFFFAAAGGIAAAASHLVASSRSKAEENTVFSTTLIFTFLVFSVCAISIIVFSSQIADLIGIPETKTALKVMGTALIFSSIGAAYKGYFQGKMAMLPSALSNVADSFGRLFAGFIMAYLCLFKPLGITAAGAITGAPFGAAAAMLILLLYAKKSSVKFHLTFSHTHLTKLLLSAIPIILTASMHPIFNLIDTFSVVPLLTYLGLPSPQTAFGHLSRSAMIYALPVAIASGISSSVLPCAAQEIKDGELHKLNSDCAMALKLALVISVPCTAGFIAILGGILSLLFDSREHAQILALIAPSAVFLSAAGVLSSILQALGKIKYAIISAVLAIFAKLVLNIALMQPWGINGSAVSTSAAYFILCFSLMFFIWSSTPVRFSIVSHGFKPLLCAFLCFTTAFLSSQVLHVIPAIFIAAVVYLISLPLTGFLSPNELNQIFSARKIPSSKPKMPI